MLIFMILAVLATLASLMIVGKGSDIGARYRRREERSRAWMVEESRKLTERVQTKALQKQTYERGIVQHGF